MQTFYDFARILKIKRYAHNTITAYCGLLVSFHKFCGIHLPLGARNEAVICTQVSNYVVQKKIAASTQRQLISALRLYFSEMIKSTINLDQIVPVRRSQHLPVILNTAEVKKIINASQNIKHRTMLTMLTMLYALGLRSGELINLKLTDFDKKRNSIHIKNAKGDKDRILPYPASLRPILQQYYIAYKPINYVFSGQNKEQYSAQSLRKVFQAACKKAQIKKSVSPHSLRHAYATHLMDTGTDLRMIQKLLGHNDIKTTFIYTHVTQRSMQQVPSPLDFL